MIGINNTLKSIKNVNILGAKPFNWIGTISVPQIPQLAKGGVLYEETAFIGGEYKGARNNPEIVTPQNIMKETFEDVLSNIDFGNNDSPISITVCVGNKVVGDILIDNLRDKKRRTGKNIEAIIGG